MGYKVLKSYCAPDKPAKKTYNDLVKLLTKNLAPALDAVSEGYRFNLMKQESGEGLSLYTSAQNNRHCPSLDHQLNCVTIRMLL